MCVTFVTCEVRVCGPRCHSGSSLYIYRVYLLWAKGSCALLVVVGVRLLGQPSVGGGDERAAWAVIYVLGISANLVF